MAAHKLLLLLLLFHVIGVTLFIIGFLLTRTVVPEYSPSCQEQTDESQCLPRSKLQFNKVVWILIDALRYDFVVYDESLNPRPPFYRNKMAIIRHYLQSKPEHTKLYKFIADPPTTTMQRLKALTTGSLPTFVDIGSNFNSYEISEDNIVLQCKKNGRRVTFMGDDTWIGLYPSQLDRVFPYPSLNVQDLHTVDNGVRKHMLPELKNQNASFIIGHLLGVDHCGHTHGPSHLLMLKKLREMDTFLLEVFSAVDNDTVVFVFGDHGMSSTGDHGGETPLETDSALIVYSPVPIFDPNKIHIHEEVYQTDIVPTVALLLGVPIPYSSLGLIIPDLFQSRPHYNELDHLHALRLNMDQVYRYLKALIKYDRTFSTPAVETLVKEYFSIKTRHNALITKSMNTFNETEMRFIAKNITGFIRGVRNVCTEKWAKFDDRYIYSGILVLLTHFIVVSSVIIYQYNQHSCRSLIDARNWTGYNWLTLVSVGLVVFQSFSLFSNSFIVFEQNVITFSSQSLLVILLLIALRRQLDKTYLPTGKEILNICCKKLWPYLGIMVCIKLTTFLHTCRDQQDECVPYDLLRSFINVPLDSSAHFIKVAMILVSVVLHRLAVMFHEHTLASYMSHSKEYENTLFRALSYAITRDSPSFVFVIFAFDYYHKSLSAALVWVVYATFIFSLSLLVWRPWLLTETYVKDMYCKWRNGQQEREKMDHTVHCLLPVHWLYMLILTPLVVIVGVSNDTYLTSIALFVLQLTLTVRILQKLPEVSLVTRAVLCSLLVEQYFFGLGHQATINSIRFEAGFVGIYGEIGPIKLVAAGILVTIHTLASQILGAVVLPLFLPYKMNVKESSNDVLYRLLKLQLLYIGIESLKDNLTFQHLIDVGIDWESIPASTFVLASNSELAFSMACTVVCASIHRRHLMLWSVFGPRFMYQAAFQTTASVLMIFMYLFVKRSRDQFEQIKQKCLQKEY